MKHYTNAGAVKQINGVSPARHIKQSKRQYVRVLEPLTIDGVLLDETYLKQNKKVFKSIAFDTVYLLGFSIAFELKEIIN